MPIITILNWSTGVDDLSEGHQRTKNPKASLALILREAATTADVSGVGPDTISVVFGGEQVLQNDPTLIIAVSGLFDQPDRTKEVRDRLARMLAQAGKEWVGSSWSVEVMIERFDPKVDSFCRIDPPNHSLGKELPTDFERCWPGSWAVFVSTEAISRA